jgi:hypothetical protein
VRGLHRLLLIIVGGSTALVWWQVLVVELNRRLALRVVPCILGMWYPALVLRRLTKWLWSRGIVCRRILAALGSLLRARVTDCGVDEEADKTDAV